MMKFDIERLRDEFNIIEKSNTESIRQHEDRIRENQFLMEEMDSRQRNLIELKVKDFYKNLSLEQQNHNSDLPNHTISDSSSKDPYEDNK